MSTHMLKDGCRTTILLHVVYEKDSVNYTKPVTIKWERREWLSHVFWTDKTRATWRIFENKGQHREKWEGRDGWLEDVQNDL